MLLSPLIKLANSDEVICSGFYRATRMHSVDYAMARCLSVTRRH